MVGSRVVSLACLLAGLVSATVNHGGLEKNKVLRSCPSQQSLPSGEVTVMSVSDPDFGHQTREYHVYVPSGYNNSQPVPLVLLWHGLNGRCGPFLKNTDFIPYADRDNFVIVSMCGTWALLGVGFNAGTCCGFPPNSTTDDLAFGRWVVSNISAELCINPEEVFIAGFSNGGFMTEVLSCNSSSIFRAAGSVSGIVEFRPGNEKGLEVCDGEYSSDGQSGYSTALLNIHGTLDPLVPWPGDPVLGFPPVPDDIARWVDRNGCEGNYTVTLQSEHYSNQLWTDCNSKSQVELVIHYGGGHEYPMTEEFNTTDYIVGFFYRNGMNSGTPRITQN